MKNVLIVCFIFCAWAFSPGTLTAQLSYLRVISPDTSIFSAHWLGFSKATGSVDRVSLQKLTFDTLSANDKDTLLSVTSSRSNPFFWGAFVVTNHTGAAQPMILHTGNIEYCNFYGPDSEQLTPIPAGYFRALFTSPEIQFSISPHATDTCYISIENFAISPKDVRLFIGIAEQVTASKHAFREEKYLWWFFFECGYLFLFAYGVINSLTNWLTLRRREFIYYAIYLIASIVLFGAITTETWVLSFAAEVEPGVPMFSLFYLKVMFIVYSISYFNFFSRYLGIGKNDKDLGDWKYMIEIVQISVIIIELILLCVNIPIGERLKGFAFLGGFLALIALIYNFILFNKKGELLKTPEVRLLNGLAALVNFVMIPITIYELIWGGSLVGPVGVFFMQIAFLAEAGCYNWTTTRKTKRLHQETLDNERKLQEMELKSLEDERKLQNIKIEFIHKIHNEFSAKVAIFCLKATNLMNNISKVDESLKNQLQSLIIAAQSIEIALKNLINRASMHHDKNLQEFMEAVAVQCREVLADSSTIVLLECKPEPLPELMISDIQKDALYLLCCEVFNNTAKHAAAQHVSIIFELQYNNCFTMIIKDDGKGFDVEKTKMGHGRGTSMKYYAEEAKVTEQTMSAPGIGTTVTIQGMLDLDDAASMQ